MDTTKDTNISSSTIPLLDHHHVVQPQSIGTPVHSMPSIAICQPKKSFFSWRSRTKVGGLEQFPKFKPLARNDLFDSLTSRTAMDRLSVMARALRQNGQVPVLPRNRVPYACTLRDLFDVKIHNNHTCDKSILENW